MPDLITNLSVLLDNLHLPTNSSELEQAQRIFHGRGHAYEGLHHVTIDWLPPIILITLFAKESTTAIDELATELRKKLPDAKKVLLQHRYLSHGPIDEIYSDESSNPVQRLEVLEGDLKFQITLGKARNTGLFLDMRNGRQWVKQHSHGKRILNLFSYTCGFSVAAIEGGAKSVLNIDMSSAALNIGRTNHRLNNHDLDNVRFQKLDIFKSFSRIRKFGPYDLLICDPPTLQKGSVDIAKDYAKIIRRLDSFMDFDSQLMMCINATQIEGESSKEFLLSKMKEFAPNYQLIEEIKPPMVYKETQGRGVKILIYKRSS
ncbi:class I SAM-dependent methyltransferase [Cocleimonas flava]|uniref:23S rRNA (Cytosine1962-C5)-methyltransferase n=1 Tax=Cocleimonas flava TaxID=634765 RepID=A0A4R1EVG8_9GAMM|nr:class I SAM-dependent methyltransferase [Cocleimonas flava]TCJ84700.1 23S rRNA (cytosine1962-C5)-methyltransferase [Cocleimonas flava]